jgi:arylsulfatase A-like enzyme
VVIFYSDNGGYGGATAQPPLRGAKGMLYEGGVRVPLFVRWPGKIKPGTKTDSFVIGVDFYPTLIQIAGVKQPLNQYRWPKLFACSVESANCKTGCYFLAFPGLPGRI